MPKKNEFLDAMVGACGYVWDTSYALSYLILQVQTYQRGIVTGRHLAQVVRELEDIKNTIKLAHLRGHNTETALLSLHMGYSLDAAAALTQRPRPDVGGTTPAHSPTS